MNRMPLVFFTLSLIAGILLADSLMGEVALVGWTWALGSWTALLSACLLAACLWGRHRPKVQTACLLCGMAALGGALTVMSERRVDCHPPGHEVSCKAVIASEPEVRGKVVKMDLWVTELDHYPLEQSLKVKASILRDTLEGRWRQLHLGNGVVALAKLEKPRALAGPSQFNYLRWLQVHGFVAQTFILPSGWQKATVDLSALGRGQRARLRLLLIRQHLLERYRRLGLDEDQYGVIAAMTLGDKQAVSKELKDEYSVSGGSHVLALSGLHLGIIYGILSLLLGVRRRRSWLGQGVVLMAIWSYVCLVGLPSSAVRSAVMLTVYGVAFLLSRDKSPLSALSFTALIMLVAHPLTLWDVSFELSFMAVLAIVLFYRPLFTLVRSPWLLVRWGWGMVCISLSAQLGTAPLVAYYFGRFSCYFLLTNFVVVPLATVMLYGAVLLLLCSPFLVLQRLLAQGLALLAWAMNTSLSHISQWPGASIEGLHPSEVQVVMLYVILAALSLAFFRLRGTRDLHRLDAFRQ